MAKNLAKSRQAILALYNTIKNDQRCLVLHKPDLDILVWTPVASSASQISHLAEEVFKQAIKEGLHLARAKVPVQTIARAAKEANIRFLADSKEVTCLRSVLLKPEHLEWTDQIYNILDKTLKQVLAKDAVFIRCSDTQVSLPGPKMA